ncbi:hypothetical protein D3C72_1355200 [compost metagenome]
MALDYYKMVKNYYDKGYYTPENVGAFVKANKITPEQYQQITGMEYAEVPA